MCALPKFLGLSTSFCSLLFLCSLRLVLLVCVCVCFRGLFVFALHPFSSVHFSALLSLPSPSLSPPPQGVALLSSLSPCVLVPVTAHVNCSPSQRSNFAVCSCVPESHTVATRTCTRSDLVGHAASTSFSANLTLAVQLVSTPTPSLPLLLFDLANSSSRSAPPPAP